MLIEMYFFTSRFRNMSSKRKSPPSKLPEGTDLADRMSEVVTASLRTTHTDAKENNDSSLEDGISRGPSPNLKRGADDTNSFTYKMSPASETSSALASGSEYEDFLSNDEEGSGGVGCLSPTQKRQRTYVPHSDTKNNFENGFLYSPYDATSPPFTIPPLSSLIALGNNNFSDFNYEMMLNTSNAINHYNINKNKKLSNIDSPMDKAFNLHLNNNNNTLHNNNEHGAICGTNGRNDGSTYPNSNKKSMDDVLKKLTSKMNDSSIKEERRSNSPFSKRR